MTKRHVTKMVAKVLTIILMLTMCISCSQQGAQGPAGPQVEAGNGVQSIVKTSTEGLIDTYTITFIDGTKTTFTVTNGASGEQGIQGIQGEPGKDGHTPIITIENGRWYIDGVDTGKSAEGIKGDTGNGISSIAKTKTEGLVDTYTIIFTNGDTTTFTVTNGTPGTQGEQGIQGIQGVPGKDGKTPVITVENGRWYIDGVDSGVLAEGLKGETGNGISSIEKTKTEGLVDTYTITFTNGNTTTFTVTNGAQGELGVGITNAYINDEVHLILVLSNGTEIDAGYVGVEVTPSYTVTFTDYDGTVIQTITDVASGSAVNAPKDPIRKGFKFIGWDSEFNCVTSNLTVKAQYEEEHNQLYFTYTDNGDGTTSVTISIEGDVNLYGLECKITFEAIGATYTSVVSNISGLAVNKKSDYIIVSFADMSGSDLTEASDLITITFTNTSDEMYLNFTVYDVDIFDDVMSDETYSVQGNTFEK